MGMALPKAVDSAVIERHRSAGFTVSVAEVNGWRTSMEDAHLIHVDEQVGVFGVYDGHGGVQCSKFVADRIQTELKNSGIPENDAAWEQLFIKVDDDVLSGGISSGTTATMCVVRKPQNPGEKHRLHVINAGDSRTILGRKDGSIVDGGGTDRGLTRDHKPCDDDERTRIYNAGGTVESGVGPGPARVNGNLSVSRGFGDPEEKKTGGPGPDNRPVTCVPEQYHFECDETDFVLLVCDGVSEGSFSNGEVVQLVAEYLKKGKNGGAAAHAVCKQAMATDSKDNITCMVVQLQGGEAMQREIEFIPGSTLKLDDNSYKTAYSVMAEKAGFSLARAVAKRYDVVQELLKETETEHERHEMEMELGKLGTPPGEPDSEDRVHFYETWLSRLDGGDEPMDELNMILNMLGKGKGKGDGKGNDTP